MSDIPYHPSLAAGPDAADTTRPERLGAGAVRAYFDATSPGIARLAFVGGLLSIVTLGIYRFWYITHLRRQLWRRSALAGTNFEYTGTVKEIFVGFLIMIAILLPIYFLAFLAQLQLGAISDIANVAFLLALFYFIGFATFRARRYRLTRTLWRGVRFGQTGSAAIYSLRNFGWMLAVSMSAGLAFPFFRASQERYRVNRTWFGDRAFTCKASGFALLLPWLLFYVAIFAPLALAVVNLLSIAPLAELGGYFDVFVDANGMPEPRLSPSAPPALISALVTIAFAVGWAVLAPILFWPVYRAREIRSFVGRTTLGATRFRSDFSAWSIYGAYLGFILLALVATAVVIGVTALIITSAGATGMSPVEITSLAAAYLVTIWLVGAIKTRFVTAKLWGRLVATTVVDGIEHLGDVGGRRDRASAVGDDFASSYDFGAV